MYARILALVCTLACCANLETLEAQERTATGWPVIVGLPPLDFTNVIQDEPRGAEYFGRNASIIFTARATDQQTRAFMTSHGLTVIGVTPSGIHWVSFAPPGSVAALRSLIDSLSKDPNVASAGAIPRELDAVMAGAKSSHEAERPPPGEWPLLLTTYPALDATRLVPLPNGSALYYRRHATIVFEDTVGTASKQQFFAAQEMTVLGVTRAGNYLVAFPDPGPGLSAFYAVLNAARADPRTRAVAPITLGGEEIQPAVETPGVGPHDAEPWCQGRNLHPPPISLHASGHSIPLGRVLLNVIGRDYKRPVWGAYIRVLPDTVPVRTDSLGRAFLPQAVGEVLTLDIRAIGYQMRTVAVPPAPSDSFVQIALVEEPFDGPCSGLAVPVRWRRGGKGGL